MYRKTSNLKIILSSILVMVLIICLGLDIWHGWIRLLAPEKEIHNTYLIGKQKVNTLNPETGEEVAVSEPFFEVNVYNNAFELKINELFDETQSGFYSHGLQYISKDGKEFTFSNNVNIESASNLSSHISSVLKKQISLKENYTFIEDIGDVEYSEQYLGKYAVNIFGIKSHEYCNRYYTQKKLYAVKSFNNLNFYEYANALETGFVESATNQINENTMFKLQIGDEIFGMKLKYDALDLTDENLIGSNSTYLYSKGDFKQIEYYNVDKYYRAIDIHYLAESIYNSVKGLSKGTSEDIVLRFGDYFEYLAYNGETYKNIETLEIKNKLIEYINSNFLIRVNVYDDNLDTSEKSFFSYYKGNQNTSEEDIENSILDYTLSKTIKLVTLNDFEWIETDVSGEYIFKLSDDFKNRNNLKRDLVLLKIELDLTDLGITCKGLDSESLKDFNIFDAKIKIKSTSRQVNYV